MGDVSNNFSRSEFACKCGCGFNAVDVELLRILEELRSEFGTIVVNSGCRCAKHNNEIGGADSSMHVKGIAADVCSPKYDPNLLANSLEFKYNNQYGIGRYSSWVHVDVRAKRARWKG